MQRDAAGRSLAEPAESSAKNSAGGLGPPVKTNILDDLIVSGNIFMTDLGPNTPRDIRTINNNAGLCFTATNGPLTTSPNGAAIQFWGNNNPYFPGELYLDSGAHNGAGLIFRTAVTNGTITERMRVTAAGRVGIGTSSPDARLNVLTGGGLTSVHGQTGDSAIVAPGNDVGVWSVMATPVVPLISVAPPAQ